jgi:hypothetical protein
MLFGRHSIVVLIAVRRYALLVLPGVNVRMNLPDAVLILDLAKRRPFAEIVCHYTGSRFENRSASRRLEVRIGARGEQVLGGVLIDRGPELEMVVHFIRPQASPVPNCLLRELETILQYGCPHVFPVRNCAGTKDTSAAAVPTKAAARVSAPLYR